MGRSRTSTIIPIRLANDRVRPDQDEGVALVEREVEQNAGAYECRRVNAPVSQRDVDPVAIVLIVRFPFRLIVRPATTPVYTALSFRPI